MSFLMKNGLIGIEFDSDGIPSLRKLVNFVYIYRHSQLTFDSGNKCHIGKSQKFMLNPDLLTPEI